MKTARILVVEDDAHIREGLAAALQSENYAVETARDGEEGAQRLAADRFDLVLLDLMMPGRSGFEVCREFRRRDARTPVIMLTAKGEEIDKVVGLELGADDYITKPFGLRELLARVAAALRRARARDAAPADAALPDEFHFGAAAVDRRRFVCRRGKRETPLTVREMKLIEIFAAHPDEVMSRDALLNAAWGRHYFGTTRTLDQHIAQLRKKIEADPADPRAILTVHGIGYRYRPPA